MTFCYAKWGLAVSAAMSTSLAFAASTFVPTLNPLQSHLMKVSDGLVAPPPDAPGTTVPEPRGQALRDQVRANLKQRFDAAADPSTHLLSQAGAKQAGMGYIADNFSAIDRSGSGYVSYEDFERYLKQRKGPAFAKP